MAKSSGTQPSQTTTYQLAPEQREILNLAMPGIRQFAAQVPERYQGNTVAPFTPEQVQGQEMALAAAQPSGGVGQVAQNAVNQSNFLSGDIWNPSSNPALSGAIDAAVRPITENYQQVVQPRTRDEFLGAGQQFGGSARDKAATADATAYMRAVGDTSSKLVQDQYANNLSAYVKALGLAPQTAQVATAPATVTSGVGDVRQAMQQALLNQDVGNFYYGQYAPFLQAQDLVGLVNSIPGASTTTTANVPGRNPITGALGGAAAGASLGSMFGPVGTAGGAGIGALLSFL